MPKFLFIYSALMAMVITLSSGRFVFLFLPVLTYFLMEISARIFFSQTHILSGKVEKLLSYYGFILSGLIVITGFVAAKSLPQFFTAFLFSPLLIYFIGKILPKRNKAIKLPTKREVVIEKEDSKEVTKLKKEGVDIDRRAFLKLIGTAGLSLFLFSMFTKKAEAAFFGSVPGPGTVSVKNIAGDKIDPSEKQPTDGYKITDLDDSSPAYYGFVNKDGGWFIQKEGTSGDYRYAKGSSGYSSNWTGRAALSYDYFDNVF